MRARDAKGQPLKVGDMVTRVEFHGVYAKPLHYAVEEVGTSEHTTGWIRVRGSVAYEHGNRFEKVNS